MTKTMAMTLCLAMFSLSMGAQTLGEKYKLPEEPGELRADGVYHLPTSLLADRNDADAYFRFYPDGTFIVFHSGVSPEAKAKVFQVTCNYQYITSTPAPFNTDFTLKSTGNISRARIAYPDRAILLEFDVRKDVIAATVRTLDLDGKMTGQPAKYVMPFHPIAWPAGSDN